MTDLITSNFSDIANISSKNAVSNTKQSSSLVPTRTIFNSNGNRNNHSNSNSNNQNVKVKDDSIKETDQSNTKVDITIGQSCFMLETAFFDDMFAISEKLDVNRSVMCRGYDLVLRWIYGCSLCLKSFVFFFLTSRYCFFV